MQSMQDMLREIQEKLQAIEQAHNDTLKQIMRA